MTLSDGVAIFPTPPPAGQPPVVDIEVMGRNDDYEPGWADHLEAAIRYNRQLGLEAGLDVRVAFVEWNPPPGRPLLAPRLVERYEFVRGVTVDPAIHDEIVLEPGLKMLLPYAANVGLRSSRADYMVITGGDVFFGRDVVRRMAGSLVPGRLYRVERVNIARDLDFGAFQPGDAERPAGILSVDRCDVAPFDEPPFTNASGDFILLDRATFAGIRGVDEGVRQARLHVDYRCVMMPMLLGLPAELLGRIFHISHARSLTNMGLRYVDRSYDYRAGLPYLNPDHWGLGDRVWTAQGDRMLFVHPERGATPGDGDAPDPLDGLGDEARAWTAWIRTRLVERHADTVPAWQGWPAESRPDAAPLDELVRLGGSASRVHRTADGLRLTTVPECWGYSARIPVRPCDDAGDRFQWVRVDLQVLSGQVGVCLLAGDTLLGEVMVGTGGREVVHLPLSSPRADRIVVRNTHPDAQASEVLLLGSAIVLVVRAVTLKVPESAT